jgi:cytochrome P450
MSVHVPVSTVDVFSDEVLHDPYDCYRTLRDAGSVVYFQKYGCYALTRFATVRDALRDFRAFSSARGIGFNDIINAPSPGNILYLEPPEHSEARRAMIARLGLGKMRDIVPTAENLAAKIVAELAGRPVFDGVTELADLYVREMAGGLLGLREPQLSSFIAVSTAGFNAVGPVNSRSEQAFATLLEVLQSAATLTKEDLVPDSIGWEILDSAERGQIPEAMRPQLLWNFASAAFDTTINAIGTALWLFAQHGEQWDRLRAEPDLLDAAVNEVLRFDSPIQVWGRECPDGAEIDGTPIPAGSRVAILIGATGRDERHYPDPDRFDVRRNPTDHQSFGNGIHRCVGAPLAGIEIAAVLKAVLDTGCRIELIGEPARRLNNTTRGFESLPLALR